MKNSGELHPLMNGKKRRNKVVSEQHYPCAPFGILVFAVLISSYYSAKPIIVKG
jgi:hypothetical protein